MRFRGAHISRDRELGAELKPAINRARDLEAIRVPQDIAETMLQAVECRLFLPGQEIALARQQQWAAWTGAEAPRVLLARVLDVIDGDTINVVVSDRMEKVRYIGVDSPELHHPTKGAEPGGREATEANRQLVAGEQVRLELDVQERDRYAAASLCLRWELDGER